MVPIGERMLKGYKGGRKVYTCIYIWKEWEGFFWVYIHSYVHINLIEIDR